MPSGLGGFDQNSATLAETFAPWVSDTVFQANRVVRVMWDNAKKMDEGRFLALPLATGKNLTATNFGQYSTLPSGPQSIYSVAAFPWSWYTAAVTLDYITQRLNRGPNMRVDNTAAQIEDAIASLTDILGTDMCSLTKAPGLPEGSPSLGVVEASDNGQLVNVYGNIARTGTNSYANWQGNVVSLAQSGIGTAANDVPLSLFTRNYTACTVGDATPTHILGNQQAIGSYMFAGQAQVRLSPGDSANPMLGNPWFLGAECVGDNHFLPVTRTAAGITYLGYNFYFVNANHTSMFYFGEKGFDFVPWIDTPNVLEKTCRYVIGFQCASDNPRLNGTLTNVNDLQNL